MTTTTSPSALTVTGLRKSFGEKTVLDGIDLDMPDKVSPRQATVRSRRCRFFATEPGRIVK